MLVPEGRVSPRRVLEIKYKEGFSITFVFAQTKDGFVFKPIIEGKDPGLHVTVYFKDGKIFSHVTDERTKEHEPVVEGLSLDVLAEALREDAERFQERWLEEYAGRVLAPTNEVIKFLQEFVISSWVNRSIRRKELYMVLDVERVESIVKALGPGALALEDLRGALRRVPPWFWGAILTPDLRPIVIPDGPEAYAVKPELARPELFRGIVGGLRPESFFRALGLDEFAEIFGIEKLFLKLQEKRLL